MNEPGVFSDPLYDYLISRKNQTLYEWDLLKAFYPEHTFRGIDLESPEFLEIHFELYRRLHALDAGLESCRRARIGMAAGILRLTEQKKGQCGFFLEEGWNFCLSPRISGSCYCETHARQMGQNLPALNGMRGFYLNPESLKVLKSMDFKKEIQRFSFYLQHHDALEAAFSLLGLEPCASLTQLKIRYREKIKEVHPDLRSQTASEKAAARLNGAFALLKEFYGMKSLD